MSKTERDTESEPRIRVMRIAGHDYGRATTVYTTKTGAETFHADKHCPHVLSSAEHSMYHGEDVVDLTAYALPRVMSSYLNPIKPCQHCTLGIEATAEVVTEHDGLHEDLLKYFEEGAERVTTRVHTDPETGETTVRHRTSEVY